MKKVSIRIIVNLGYSIFCVYIIAIAIRYDHNKFLPIPPNFAIIMSNLITTKQVETTF